MYLMIDNYDSFVYNLVSYFKEENISLDIIRNDEIDFDKIDSLIKNKQLEAVVISPGPKSPKDIPLCKELISRYYKDIPIFGVCLGHQTIGEVFGAKVVKGIRPMHGKVEMIENNGKAIFSDLPKIFTVTRYHSLHINEDIDKDFSIDAKTKDGVIMGISHKKFPLYGVQFHPEAVLTEYGHEMIRNFISLTNNWWANV